MTVPGAGPLRPDALAGRTVLLADVEAVPGGRALAGGLARLGAAVRHDDAAEPGDGETTAPVDLYVAAVPAPGQGDEPHTVPAAVATRAFTLARAAYPALTRRPGGLLYLLPPEQDADTGAAAAVRSLTRTLAHEWAGEGVRVNCLAVTPAAPAGPAAVAAPAGAAGLLGVVALLASPAAAMVTAQVLEAALPTDPATPGE